MARMKIHLLSVLILLGLTRALADESDVALAGQKAPAFTGTATDGSSISLAAFSG